MPLIWSVLKHHLNLLVVVRRLLVVSDRSVGTVRELRTTGLAHDALYREGQLFRFCKGVTNYSASTPILINVLNRIIEAISPIPLLAVD